MELESERSAAKAASEAKGRFLANMSHELRTPINAILGYGELLMEDCERLGNDQMMSDLKKIRKAGTHLTKLISNILDLSKIEAGKIDISQETLNIDGIILEIADTARPLITKNENQFSIEVEQEIGEMVSDRTILQQILLNLLSNAGKFTAEGDVTLKVTSTVENGIDYIKFTVTDTGVGIKDDQLNIIFNEFSQANSLSPSQNGGIGLGLNIAKKYSLLLNGKISAASKVNQGSQFTVMLPRNMPSSNVISIKENQA